MLQKKCILLLLGGVVCVCAAGCEEDPSLQAGKDGAATVRPVNHKPGQAAPPPAGATTAPSTAPAASPAAAATPQAGPVPIHKPSDPPRDESAEGNPTPDPQNVRLTREQYQLFDDLRQESLKLQMKLDDLQEQNERLTRALVDSRDTGRSLQDNLQRATIVQEIQRRELVELKERFGPAAKATPRNKTHSTTAPVEASRSVPKDPVDLLREITRLRRGNEKLRLQLQLARLDAPNAREKVLLKLGEETEQNEKLEKLNRRLSHMVVAQADQIRKLQARGEKLDHIQAEHAEQIAQIDRRMRKELATRELNLAEAQKRLGALRDQLARREYEIRLLKEQLASQPSEPAGSARKAEPAVSEIASAPAVAAAAPPAEPAPAAAAKPAPVETSAAPVRELSPAAAPASQAVTGNITAIKGLMVMIDAGKNNGVEDGMRLIVYRDDKFIGYLRVEQTAQKESACTFTRQILPPRVGDNVIDRLE
ncbi:MAG: hypothetical protein JW849_06715 [Phycisphaerae bacterium]|nr:hypothetical protein [Phycisphaerae bacterium]